MAKSNWWLNRVGTFAPNSNAGSAVPNYGLTFDVATAPWDSNADFNALVQSNVTSMMAAMQGIVGKVSRPAEFVPGRGDDANVLDMAWSGVKNAGGALASGAKGAVGGIDALADRFGGDATLGGDFDKLSAEADERGLKGWDRLTFIGGRDLTRAGEGLADDQVASKLFWALDKASEGAATVFVTATEAQRAHGENSLGGIAGFFDSDIWGRAHHQVKKYDLNAGEGFMQMLYDDELLHDEDRFREMRKNSGFYNFGATAFNATMAWKFDPAVLAAKGGGAVRDMRAGTLDKTDSASAVIQRSILGQKTRADAELLARNAGGMANRVRANRALTLWDKSQGLREMALAARNPDLKDFGYEEFRNLGPFDASNPSGAVMSKLMFDVADDDDAWNLVFRASIGDHTAIPELHAREGSIADKINAMELGPMPTLERQFDDVSARYEARLKEQGGKVSNNDRLILTSAHDYFLDQDFQLARTRLDEAKARLDSYKEHESWLSRATAGTHRGEGTKVNTVFDHLDKVNAKTLRGKPATPSGRLAGRATNSSLYALRGAYSTFRHDEFGPLSRVITAPAKPLLKRTGWADLTNIEEGASTVAARLDQIAYFTGKRDTALRDEVLGRWAGTLSEVERKGMALELDRQGIDVVFRKHGIDNKGVREALVDLFMQKRGQGLSRISDRQMYSTVKDEKGRRLDFFEDVDDKGTVTRIQMPLSVTELPNWHPFINLTDLDRTVSMNKHRFLEMNQEANILARKGKFAGDEAKRLLNQVYNEVGETFNTYWKPAALFSLRWPSRVVADETMRAILFLGAATYMQTAAQGASNVLHNTGFVKPFEWAKGRVIKTGSISEDSLRVNAGAFDPYDIRVKDNPTAAVPAQANLFDGADETRHARLLEQAAEQRTFLRKGQMGVKPRWAQRFEDRVAALEGSDTRGFFFDPINQKARNKGFAVSVYPGRLRTFDKKPSSAELHWWTEKNTDVLSIPDNQVAVWLDKETGRWHLDVVKTHRRREDAMVTAAKAEAPEFYDITDGFTRHMADEDRFGHAGFAANGSTDTPPGETPEAFSGAVRGVNTKRKVGVGTRSVKAADGKTVEYEDVYGPNVDNLNIYYSAHSSRGAFQQIFGGYAKGLGGARAARGSTAPRSISPGDPDDIPQQGAWAHAQSQYVNKHFRMDPIWRRMLAGQTDEQIESWLRTPQGRQVRDRMGKRALHPGAYVEDMRLQFDKTLPTEESRLAALQGDIEPEQWDDLIPLEARQDIHGDDILLAQGSHRAQGMLRGFVDTWMGRLATMPTDTLVRHPFGATVYNQRMRNYIRTLDADEITPEVMAAAAASARTYATKTIGRVLYNMADEVEVMHMMRFLSPFIQAQIEVLEKYGHLFTSKPEAMVRFAQLYFLSQNEHEDRGLWHMVDADGNPTGQFSHDNKMVLQENGFVKALKKRLGLKGAGNLKIPVASIDLVFQGEKPWLPSMGPLVTYPASEFYYKDRPWKTEGEVFKSLFPYGLPAGDNFVERGFNSVAPAYVKRLYTALTEDFDDNAFATFASRRFTDLQHDWEKEHGRPLPARLAAKLEQQAHDQTKAYYLLRAVASFSLPVPLEAGSKYQFFYDQAAKYRRKYGIEADRKFYDEFGADFFKFFTESSKSFTGLAPTIGAVKGYRKFKDQIDQAPLLAGVIVGPAAQEGEFSYEAYRWQFRNMAGGPMSKQAMRESLDPKTRIKENQINRGWIEYSKLAAAVDVEMRARGLTSLNSNAAADLQAFKASKVREIIDRNPAWQGDYRSREDTLSPWLNQASTVLFDKALDGRTDIEGMRAYLLSRDKVQELLFQRQAQGGSASLSAETNSDLAGAWNSYLTELTSKNLLFAEIYHRYLEGDDLTVVVND